MSEKKRILVTGATGAQGGSVARHLIARGQFLVRGLTRNPDSEKAQALAAAGAEMVGGDLDNVDSLHAALADCEGVFGVTNFWEHFEKERQQGINLIDAVASASEKIEHFVLSTLPSAKEITKGELDVPHFDIKAELEAYARERVPQTTFIHVAFYYENFLYFLPPQKQEDGSYAFGFPQGETPLAAVSVEDTGGVVAAIFERPAEFIGKTIGIVGDDLPPAAYAETMTQLMGRTIKYNHIPREVFANLGFPGADDLANMFDFNRRFIPQRTADLNQSLALYPGMKSFEAWLADNKEKFSGMLAV